VDSSTEGRNWSDVVARAERETLAALAGRDPMAEVLADARRHVYAIESQAVGQRVVSGKYAGKRRLVQRPLYEKYEEPHVEAYAGTLRDRPVRLEPGSYDERLWAVRLLHAADCLDTLKKWVPSVEEDGLPRFTGTVRPTDVHMRGGRASGSMLRQSDVDAAWDAWVLLWRCARGVDLMRQINEHVGYNVELSEVVDLPLDMTLTRHRLRDWLGLGEEKARIWPHAMLEAGAIRVSREEPTRRSSNPATYYAPV
jgi:hypothetical protein